MESSDPHGLPDPPDWDLLSATFAEGGTYRHRMGLRRAEAREFYADTHANAAILREKQAILEKNGDRQTLVTREGHRAAVEFAATLGVPADNTDDSAGTWRRHNRRLSLAIEPDLLFVQPPDWSLIWASVCFPSRWSLEGKAGRPLDWIHAAVPGLNQELGRKIATFFSRLTPGEGWRRANWGLSASASRNQHPAEAIPPLNAGMKLEEVFIRIEDQHLLKLSKSGAIAFGIRIASFACSDVMQNPSVGASLIEKLRTMSPELARYKSVDGLIPQFANKS